MDNLVFRGHKQTTGKKHRMGIGRKMDRDNADSAERLITQAKKRRS
ncbi:MAG: hypothetical protein K2I96_14505 [Lachnospiraceae bacterium]|nr:hypothetical protein [Lachnospiraceae bacterium]